MGRFKNKWSNILIKTIFEAIDNCDIFACDLTYMNLNVFFELGYVVHCWIIIMNAILRQMNLYCFLIVIEGCQIPIFKIFSGAISENVVYQTKATAPHKYRHAFATLLYQNGVDIFTTQKMLGHSDLNSTKILRKSRTTI